MRCLRPVVFSFVTVWGVACQPALQVKLAPGAVCASTVVAKPTAQGLSDALSGAQRGTCVVAPPGRYVGTFSVPVGVTLAAEIGTQVDLVGDSPDVAAVTLSSEAALSGLQVIDSPSHGIALMGERSQLISIQVRNARKAGVVSWCEDDCRVADPSELHDVELTGNAVGLLVNGARLKVLRGRVTASHSTSLSYGYGVVASGGAALDMVGTVVDGNQELGVLIDGNLGTEATLEAVSIRDNRGRGIWAQGLLGTVAAPKLQLKSCAIEGNRLVGLGARASRGILMQDGRVERTVRGLGVSATPGVLVEVGDGVGLFENTGDVTVDAVTLNENQRSQALIDSGAAGLVFQGTNVVSTGSQLGLVVQRTSQTVTAPMVTVPMPGQELDVSAPSLGLPSP